MQGSEEWDLFEHDLVSSNSISKNKEKERRKREERWKILGRTPLINYYTQFHDTNFYINPEDYVDIYTVYSWSLDYARSQDLTN